MLDHRYRETALGPAVVEWLAYFELKGRSLRTLDQYERDLSVGALLFPDKGLGEWTEAEVMQTLTRFPEGSQKRARAAYVALFAWAYLMGRIDRDPMGRVPSRKVAKVRVREADTFTDAEVERLVGLPSPDGPLLLLMFDAGLRRGECLGLQGRDVNLETRLVTVREGKGRKDRVVPMTTRLVSSLATMFLVEGIEAEDFLWYTRKANAISSRTLRAKPLGDGSFYRWWDRCLDAAGVERRPGYGSPTRKNPHLARHTYAGRWLRGKVGRSLSDGTGPPGRMETLQRAMGHASIATTVDEYGHLDVEDAFRDLAAMEPSEDNEQAASLGLSGLDGPAATPGGGPVISPS